MEFICRINGSFSWRAFFPELSPSDGGGGTTPEGPARTGLMDRHCSGTVTVERCLFQKL